MTKDGIIALAERVERLDGADREVDLKIHQHGCGKTFRWSVFGGAFPDQREIAVEVLPEPFASDHYWFKRAEIIKIPAYTASLDAAMGLVPEGWNSAAGQKADHGWAYINNRQPHFIGVGTRRNPERIWIECNAETPAIALTAAALRAIAASMEDE